VLDNMSFSSLETHISHSKRTKLHRKNTEKKSAVGCLVSLSTGTYDAVLTYVLFTCDARGDEQ